MIKAKNISFNAGGREILKNINFELPSGVLSGVAGPNGSGKTTLLNILCGALKPTEGEVFLDGQNITELTRKERALLFSYLPAEIFLPFDFKVKDIIIMGRAPHKNFLQNYDAQDAEIAAKAAERIGIADKAQRTVNTLSSGEKQKVFIAQALAQNAKILFLDEPNSHLDLAAQQELMELLKSLENITAVIVSHDVNLLKKHCALAVLLENGRIAAQGAAQEVFSPANINKVYKRTII